eukprot:scaffold10262_cov131-Chaetoceros_neogracile.AAC.2
MTSTLPEANSLRVEDLKKELDSYGIICTTSTWSFFEKRELVIAVNKERSKKAPQHNTPTDSTPTSTTSASKNAGTTLAPYQASRKAEGTSSISFQSITAMAQYEHKSFEELRVEDYMAGNKGSQEQEAQPTATVAFRAAPAYHNRVILRGRRPAATSANPTTDTATNTAASIPAWSSTFNIDKASWKCEVCMSIVRNNGNVSKCAACKIVPPSHENNAQTGGESKGSAQIGGGTSSGFTFSAAGAGEDSTSTSKGAGFSFGFSASSKKPKASAASFDYGFGAPPKRGLSASPASSRFSFGFKESSPTCLPTSGSESRNINSNATKLVSASMSSTEAKHAAKHFDTLDQDKAGKIPIDRLESLLDEIGEGFHGDELDKQFAIFDPDSSGFISRSSFIDWYCKLGDDSDDNGSLDTEEREEREEETAKAVDTFESIATAGVVKNTEFGKLMEAMGTTYCEEEHRRTIKKISDDSGSISQEAFVSWYTDWLFGDGDESDCSDSEEDNNHTTGNEFVTESAIATSSCGWGSTFAVDKDSWKCEACMVRNNGDVAKCAACEIVRPGHENNAQTGGESKSSANIEGGANSGFTFSAAGAGEDSTSSSKGAGFSFGFSASSNAPKAPAASFDYGIGAPPTTGLSASPVSRGFSFGYNTASPIKKAAPTPFGGSSTKPVASSGSAFPPMSAKAPAAFVSTKKPVASSSAFPPMSAKAPTPFVSTTKPVAISGSAFPPISAKAPTTFGGSTTKPVASSGSAFPPMSTKAPTPFGGSTKKLVASSVSAFPLMSMSTKAPTPFSGSTTKPVASSGSAFQPMSTKAPTPFGGGASCGFAFSAAGDDRSTLLPMSSSKTNNLQLAAEALAKAASLMTTAASPEVDPVTQNLEALKCSFKTELDALTRSIKASNENFDAKINSVNQKIANLCSETEKTNTLLKSQAKINANICLATEKTNTLLESQAKVNANICLATEKIHTLLESQAEG